MWTINTVVGHWGFAVFVLKCYCSKLVLATSVQWIKKSKLLPSSVAAYIKRGPNICSLLPPLTGSDLILPARFIGDFSNIFPGTPWAKILSFQSQIDVSWLPSFRMGCFKLMKDMKTVHISQYYFDILSNLKILEHNS